VLPRELNSAALVQYALAPEVRKDAYVFVEDKRPLCQLSSKRLEDNWHSCLLLVLYKTSAFWKALTRLPQSSFPVSA